MMLLTTNEIEELTHKKRSKAQSKVLSEMGIEHKTRPDGSIAVLASLVEKALGGDGIITKEDEPDWSRIDDAAA